MKFTAPIVVPDMPSGPSSPPKPSYLPPDMMPSAPPTPSNLPPDMMPSAPPKPSYLPPDMLPSSPPKSSYLPPNMMPSAPGSQFLPTILPEESTSVNPVIDLLSFPPHVNSSYIPNELDAIKNSIDSNHQPDAEPASDETTYTPPKNLYNFPPNIDSSYLPPDSPDNSDGPPIIDMMPYVYVPPKDLHNFPPNIDSSYLPPSMIMNNKDPINSYLPPPSGDTSDSSNVPSPEDESLTYTPPKDLHNFPPNIDSSYLPPNMMMRNKNPVNSYLPPPSGDISDNSNIPPDSQSMAMAYTPPKDLHNFPPNIDSSYLPPGMQAPDIPSNSYYPAASGNEADIPAPTPYMYIPPKNPQNSPPSIDSSYLPPGMKQVIPSVNSYLPPSSGSVSGFDDGSKQNLAGPMPPQMNMPMDQSMPMNMPMNMPMGMDMQSPMDMPMPSDDDHHHHHHHDHDFPDFSQWMGSDLIYDDHHHHHHHEETTTTTEAPPEEPRVKKYSYYYLGRKLWYIPLYFTLWFCLYVVALIIRSIGRHKVK